MPAIIVTKGSDMGEFFNMARKGRVYLIGSGRDRVNPIHGADLAVASVDAIAGERRAIDVGGPDIMTWNEVADLAFTTLSKPAKVTRAPAWLLRAVVRAVRLFNRHQGELLAFFTTMSTTDVVAPATGSHTLEEYYRTLAAENEI